MQRHTILIVLDYAGLNNTQYSAVCRSGMADSPASRYSSVLPKNGHFLDFFGTDDGFFNILF